MLDFIGKIAAKVDAKGRVFVPASYRKIFSAEDKMRFVMRKDPDFACFVLYPEQVWTTKIAALQARLDEWNPDDQFVLSQYVSEAEWMELDSQGRILLNKRCLQQIGVESEVLFVGMINRIAIWNRATYENSRMNASDFAQRLAEKMAQKPEN